MEAKQGCGVRNTLCYIKKEASGPGGTALERRGAVGEEEGGRERRGVEKVWEGVGSKKARRRERKRQRQRKRERQTAQSIAAKERKGREKTGRNGLFR